MTEAELQHAVIELAHVFRWKVAHFRPAMNAKGEWQTPVAADGAGFPDLVLARNGRVVFVELKSAKGRVSPEQQGWINAVGGEVWRPADWMDGTIERFLT